MATLRLGGEEFRCIPTLPVGVIFDMIENGERAKDGATDVGVIMRLRDLLNTVVEDDEIDRLWALLRDKHSAPSIEELTASIEKAIEEYAGRPTERPSPSPRGGSRTDGGSKGGSSSRGTAGTGARSPRAGR